MFKVGDRVILITNRFGDTSVNPVWNGRHGKVVGRVIEFQKGDFLSPYRVIWDNHVRNAYNEHDLRLYKLGIVDKLFNSILEELNV